MSALDEALIIGEAPPHLWKASGWIHSGIYRSASGYCVTNPMAAKLRDKAQAALNGGFNQLRAEGSGASHNEWIRVAEEFALAVVALCADRDARLRDVKKFRRLQPLWRRGWAWLGEIILRRTKQPIFLAESLVAEARRNASWVLTEGMTLYGSNPPWTSHPAYVATGEYFAVTTQLLCRDRELLILICRGGKPQLDIRAGLRPRHTHEQPFTDTHGAHGA